MLPIVAMAAIIPAMLCLEIPAGQAQTSGNAPWCAVVNRGAGDVVSECYYRSAEECAPNVVAGNRGFCNINPYFVGVPAPQGIAPAHHRHHAYRY
jgi:hypothetical protein